MLKVLVSTKVSSNKIPLSLQKIKVRNRKHNLFLLSILNYLYQYQLLISKLWPQTILNCFFYSTFSVWLHRWTFHKQSSVYKVRYGFKWTNYFYPIKSKICSLCVKSTFLLTIILVFDDKFVSVTEFWLSIWQ